MGGKLISVKQGIGTLLCKCVIIWSNLREELLSCRVVVGIEPVKGVLQLRIRGFLKYGCDVEYEKYSRCNFPCK